MKATRITAGVVLAVLVCAVLLPQAALAKTRVVELYIPGCG